MAENFFEYDLERQMFDFVKADGGMKFLSSPALGRVVKLAKENSFRVLLRWCRQNKTGRPTGNKPPLFRERHLVESLLTLIQHFRVLDALKEQTIFPALA